MEQAYKWERHAPFEHFVGFLKDQFKWRMPLWQLGSRREKRTYVFEQEIDRSIYEQLDKLNARYTCQLLVEGVIKKPEWNYNQNSSPDSKEYTIRKTNL